MDTDIKAILETDMTDAFGLNDVSEEERNVFLDEVGSVVIESALLSYLIGLEDEAQKEFEKWVDENASAEDFLQKLLTTYPEFEKILTEEIVAFKSEAKVMLEESN